MPFVTGKSALRRAEVRGRPVGPISGSDAGCIFFLQGLPNFQLLGRLRIGENVEEVLKADLELELEALPDLKDAIAHCEKVRDFVSRDLFQHLLESEESHVDELETQLELIRQMGVQNYAQLQSESPGS